MYLFRGVSRLKLLGVCVLVGAMSAWEIPVSISNADDGYNRAAYVLLKNCGGYRFKKTQLEHASVDDNGKVDSSWTTWGDSNYNKDAYIPYNYGVCWFVGWGGTNDLEDDNARVVRIRAHIQDGDTKSCDSTRIQFINENEDESAVLRTHVMKGTTLNNNGCKSQSYRTKSLSHLNQICSVDGKIVKVSC